MEEPVHERPRAYGFAISIGDLPAGAAGELGSGDGLRVSSHPREYDQCQLRHTVVAVSTDGQSGAAALK